jgi:hypothetical protein
MPTDPPAAGIALATRGDDDGRGDDDEGTQ